MIRPAIPSDEADIRACAESAYVGYVAVIGREPAPMVADFAAQIAAGQVHVSMGEDDVMQGFIVFFPQEDSMLLENVAVWPWASGQGVGKALIGFCEDEARRLGCRAARLYTNEKMTDNLSIYPKLGYVEVDRRAEDGFNRVFFEKRIG
ncbi:acetyltransferase [Skermanella stibiiresistens SB22]|uniref:Acetyltransferase n=1 Tax=Skermanella stibiiresistens SB22 TaxID=1385369 RepID=W9GWW9_9PROT|nr:GNAT family N-acetyltransferase [Skermanella stibiiresistens]EWY36952.1 acetyltransferase [Skermanella stibiiresistens SB22]